MSYKGNYADIKCNIGVLCTWHQSVDESRFIMSNELSTAYHSLANYLCTLTSSCTLNSSIASSDLFTQQIVTTTSEVTLTSKCMEFVSALASSKPKLTHLSTEPLASSSSANCQVNCGSVKPSEPAPSSSSSALSSTILINRPWVKCGSVILHQYDRHSLINGKWLSDLHINASQQLLSNHFYHLGGLQSTLTQYKEPIKNPTNAIQILHVNNNHWSVLTTININQRKCQAHYYDSMLTSLTPDVEYLISRRLPSENHRIDVDRMIVSQQAGSSDCGVFAIAVATALAFGTDPSDLMFHQAEMREHLAQCLDKKMTLFPTKSRKRHTQKILKTITIYLCPVCEKPDDGCEMVCCDDCHKWFHQQCVPKKMTFGNVLVASNIIII